MTISDKPSYNSRAVRLGRQVQADLRRGRFKPGERLPTEQELAGLYQVSRSTIRRTMERLVADECLVKTPWRGIRVPGGAAEPLGNGGGRQIAWITASMSGEAEEYARGLQNVVTAAGFTLGVYCSQADPGRLGLVLEHLLGMGPAGIILQHSEVYQQTGNHDRLAKALLASGIPVIRLDSEDALPVAGDQVHGSPHYVGRLVARYLAAKNYRDLTFFSECPENEYLEVVSGLREGLAPAGIVLPDERVVRFQCPRGYGPAPDPFIDAEETAKAWLAGGFRRGTLIAGHDYPRHGHPAGGAGGGAAGAGGGAGCLHAPLPCHRRGADAADHGRNASRGKGLRGRPPAVAPHRRLRRPAGDIDCGRRRTAPRRDRVSSRRYCREPPAGLSSPMERLPLALPSRVRYNPSWNVV